MIFGQELSNEYILFTFISVLYICVFCVMIVLSLTFYVHSIIIFGLFCEPCMSRSPDCSLQDLIIILSTNEMMMTTTTTIFFDRAANS